MTVDEFTNQLPELTRNALPIKPPLIFNGMSARVFPLRASLGSLQQLCDGYLNFVPPEAGRFRVPAPYVLLMLLDYGQVSQSVTSLGWFAQVEVFFSVIVEWYKFQNGQWVFHDWAIITPYIFVNDSFSVPLGRNVYGFPKVAATMDSAPNQWIRNPTAPVTLGRFQTMVFPEAYAGKRLENKVFLEIERDGPMVNFRTPPDPASPMMPWVVASHLANGIAGFGRDALWMAQALRIFSLNPFTLPSASMDMLARLAPALAPFGKGFVQNSINLKQFRAADAPEFICFQSLTNSCMRMTGFNSGGLLGEERTFLGDFSGGYTVRLYEHGSLPIVNTLGLEVSSRHLGDDGPIVELQPTLPFWANLDIVYDQGANLAWRSRKGIWYDETGAAFPDQTPVTSTDAAPEFNSAVNTALEAITGPFEFSDSTIRVLPLLAQIEKLKAFVDQAINASLSEVIHQPDGSQWRLRLSVWARPPASVNTDSGPRQLGGDLSYVYLITSSYGNVLSKTNNVGDWAKYELAFMIPVKFERCDGDDWEDAETVGVGLLPAFMFVDDSIAAISRSEVQGLDITNTAEFVRPESVWLSTDAPELSSNQTLLRMDAEVWPAFGEGQKSRIEPVIEISHRVPNAGLPDADPDGAPLLWAETLRLELAAKNAVKQLFSDQEAVVKPPTFFRIARALSLELLGNRTPFSIYTMKQFRDVRDPDRACYQEFLRMPRVLKDVIDIREIEETLVVRIHDYASLKIAETLGIVAPTADDSGAGIVYTAQAIRPFYITGTLVEPPGEPITMRAGSREWELFPDAFQSVLRGEDNEDPPLVVDFDAERAQNLLDSCQMTFIMSQARERFGRAAGDRISKAQARDALAAVDPQMVIDSILSREWGNLDPHSRWRRGRGELLRAFEALPQGESIKARPQGGSIEGLPAVGSIKGQPGVGSIKALTAGVSLKAITESLLYRIKNNLMSVRQGAVASPIDLNTIDQYRYDNKSPNEWQIAVTGMLKAELSFTTAQIELEDSYNQIAPLLLLGATQSAVVMGLVQQPVLSKSKRDRAAQRFLGALEKIAGLPIAGLPIAAESTLENVEASKTRLKKLLEILKDKITEVPDVSAGVSIDDVTEALRLARTLCGTQREAILDKFAHAYQKPDFCIRRDSVGTAADRLLRSELSWDDDWYAGADIPRERADGVPRDQTGPIKTAGPKRRRVKPLLPA